MKILRLQLCNLASLSGEQEINFEAEPLAHAGLIAITGKTGAGKSTLLDAMCLALFDQIPRLNGAVGTLLDASGQGISVKDSKHILRRGATQGFAEVEFLALDQKRYIARWEIRRARNKLDGNLKLDRAIRCVEDGRVLTQKLSECTPTVQKLIGLSFEQFTRAVLLAQSEVGAFLKAKDQDRADLLEYLTNSNIFSLVSQLSFQKTKQFKDELDNLKKVLGHIELLSSEQIHALEQEKSHYSVQIQQKQLEQKQLEQAEHWFKRHNELNSKIAEKQTQLQHCQNQQSQINIEKELLRHLEEFAEIRATLLELDKAIQQKTHFTQQLQQSQQHFQQIKLQYDTAQQQHQNSEQQLKLHKQKVIDLQPALQQALDYDAERLRIGKNYKEKKQDIEDNQRQLSLQQQQLENISKQLQQVQQQQQHTLQQLQNSEDIAAFAEEPKASLEKIDLFLRQYQQLQQHTAQSQDQFKLQDFAAKQQALNVQIQQHEQQFGTLDQIEQAAANQQTQWQNVQQQQHAANAFARSLNNCLELSKQSHTLDSQIKTLQSTQTELLQQQQLSEQHYQQADQHVQQVQQLLAEQRLLQAKHIENLRASLQQNQPCMVCGSSQHPFVEHAETLQQALSQIHSEQEQQAIDSRNHALQQLEQIKQQVIECQSHLKHQQQRNGELSTQLQHATKQLHADFAATGFQLDLQQTFEVLQQQFSQANHQLKLQLEQQQQQLQHWQQILRTAKALQQQKQQQQQIAEQIERYQQAAQAILTQLNASWLDRWQQQPEPTARQLQQAIMQRVKQRHTAEQQGQQLDQLNTQLQPVRDKLNWLQDQAQSLHNQLAEISRQGQANTDLLMAHLAKYSDQNSEQPFKSGKEWQENLFIHTQTLEQHCEQSKQQFMQVEQRYQQQQTQLAQLKSQLEIWQKQLEECESAKTRWFTQHPHFDQALQQHCLKQTPQDIQTSRQRIQQFERELTEIQSTLELYQQELSDHLKTQPEIAIADVQQQMQQLDQVIQDLMVQRDEINAKLMSNAERAKEQQQYQQQITALQQQVNRWGKISELIGSKEGTKFQRIAQEHHLDILVEYANQQLEPLAPRYQLQRIPDSLGLAIIDHDMNAEVRPVLSLSGGETFLVSLALALAIANMASGSMKLESLFIDEGFGTLDPTSLHIVMDALDRLQSQGRKVVLISHVQEMHERIPVQIQVKAVGSGASQIEVVG
ncbi:AAA family ATPase [Acinetobacter populi]|uniref:Rad50/SbcC-type AAA domain-containing protein n=1 Tax=Acinetobacter populi TaxID=1582270 RepID=A0A1Z9Z1E4_9GAMM|nr:AAA family ATPase [Acinetobacter populi]OUY08280.1 hypothetical protein CAP51_01265 [Acinetobacter populi]